MAPLPDNRHEDDVLRRLVLDELKALKAQAADTRTSFEHKLDKLSGSFNARLVIVETFIDREIAIRAVRIETRFRTRTGVSFLLGSATGVAALAIAARTIF